MLVPFVVVCVDRYLGAVRQLSAANRSKVRVIREKNGLQAAITAAKKLTR
jgi:hypothetical protein